MQRLLLILLLAFVSFEAVEASAVLIAGPDGSINVTAPDPDPGFSHVGEISGLSGVYVGNGWVLTARHVGLGSILLGGVEYEAVPGSRVTFEDGTGATSDLIAFKLVEHPPLPDLDLPSAPPIRGEDVILIGNGRARGAETSWMGNSGWEWGVSREIRWGTNRISEIGGSLSATDAFVTSFDRFTGSRRNDPEAQAVPGDSGGAVFVWNGETSELVGILFAQGLYLDQPDATTFYGNVTYSADLYAYRSEILAVITQPDCSDGLDEDGDGAIDYPEDPGCSSASDSSELSALLVCDNGLDDDFDGLIDFPQDGGCENLLDPFEVPEPGLTTGLMAGCAGLAALRRSLLERGRSDVGTSPNGLC